MNAGAPAGPPAVAIVIGAGGGIGAALVAALAESGAFITVHALSRTPPPVGAAGTEAGESPHGIVRHGHIDVTDEASIAAAAARIAPPVQLVIVATGILHAPGHMPEKALRDLDPVTLARLFQVNTIGPALALKHFVPLLAKDRRAVIACLSARVGSISDNRSGGWYGYRASKAALNMIVKSAAIELARTRPKALCVALHPGTVDSALSKPFQARVPAQALFTPARAAKQLIAVLDALGPEQNGRILAWDGREIAP